MGFEGYLWAAQRITGLILILFFIVHLSTLSSIFSGEAAYDQVLLSLDAPPIKMAALLLLWVVLFHGLNGLRLILFNLFPGINHKRLAYSISIISFLIVLLSIPFVVS